MKKKLLIIMSLFLLMTNFIYAQIGKTKTYSNIRNRPSKYGKKIFTLSKNKKINIIRKYNNWYLIEVIDINNKNYGKKGYIYKSLISLNSQKISKIKNDRQNIDITKWQIHSEKTFISIIKKYAQQYSLLSNELKKSKLKYKLKKKLAEYFNDDLKIKYWKGRLTSLSTTTDGSAYITIQLPNSKIEIETMNNSFSDNNYNTLISVDDKLFDKISDLSIGNEIYFSGNFFRDNHKLNYIKETSLTESGSMKKPEFLFNFDEILTKTEVINKIQNQIQEKIRKKLELALYNKKIIYEIINSSMIWVEGGTFMMGTPDKTIEYSNDERPVHKVRVNGFYIGKYEVTQKLWKLVMGNNPSSFKGDNLPVEKVSWNDCQKFIKKLNRLTKKKFRLPTEAEWEYACRGGGKSKGYKYSGSDNIDEVVWYYSNSGRKTHQVGQKKPNELGIYDMSGNIWEWCQDWYDKNYYMNSPIDNPTGTSSGSDRVYRGGGWSINAGYCRSADRFRRNSTDRLDNLGFRLLLSAGQ